ncbi:peptidoglycan/xylan/chitin deacetylase (PgdA/CDA1 family) [Paenibacillus phyllosphaerae]|uniref:Peptidoglycan/xylan/chitin deacetylase (PgdA/CDA1 family) n=1 Tax=Paenibacillus phyllosphaerae TaxID=274593 RepID=A0A7W5ASX8_9BACL|nr:polysaccharide deacetylase family protein [Paenibacillus phyllosphaerae]MBB3108215.1 peptidoglycan/xylan/chitin deacetylase (PgdA/CDA1 family) [Paenibacillus phyllosphaerae]
MENILLWMFYFLTFYAFLPGLISRTFGFRVFKRGKAEKEIALTFDDGPDPVYTPQLLDLLKRYNAKATFFVVGIHAEKHPELLQRMHAEGHKIGIHNYVHKSNWLMRPSTVKKQIHMTSDIIEKATGQRTNFYRPPWGIVNLFDFAKHGDLQIILWSSLFSDWRKRVGVPRLTKRMMKKLKPGEVLLLHDCGATPGADEDAPANMLQALEMYMEEGVKRGYQFVHISEMMTITDRTKEANYKPGLLKRMIVGAWLAWEKVFHVLFKLESCGPDSIFHIRVTKYHGRDLALDNGRTLHDKDDVIELHLDNGKLHRLMKESKSLMHLAIRMIREVEQTMPRLAALIAGREEYKDARAVYGISMINRGVEKFGFNVSDLPKGLFDRMTRVYLRLMLRVLNPAGKSRLKDHREKMKPRIMAMSIEDFWQRYGTGDMMDTAWKASAAGLEDSRADGTNEQTSLSHTEYEGAARGFTP